MKVLGAAKNNLTQRNGNRGIIQYNATRLTNAA
jgi:hypothetical protein